MDDRSTCVAGICILLCDCQEENKINKKKMQLCVEIAQDKNLNASASFFIQEDKSIRFNVWFLRWGQL